MDAIEVTNLATEAWNENGEILAVVWCRQCGDGAPELGHVRTSSRGLVYNAELPPVDYRQRYDRKAEKEVRRQTGWRWQASGHAEVCRLLLDQDVEHVGGWPPLAYCDTHKLAEVSEPVIRQAIRSNRSPRPAKIHIH